MLGGFRKTGNGMHLRFLMNCDATVAVIEASDNLMGFIETMFDVLKSEGMPATCARSPGTGTDIATFIRPPFPCVCSICRRRLCWEPAPGLAVRSST